MTPAARISAAIDVMDRVLAGELADRVLAAWGRRNRYAGSKDRAAIADLVYDVLRRKRSLAARGGGETGRALLLGYVRDSGQDPDSVFGAGPYAPSALTDEERSRGRLPQPDSSEGADLPEWLWPEMRRSLGDRVHDVARTMQRRAPVHLRVNLARLSRHNTVADLASEGIAVAPHPLSPSTLEVIDGSKKIRTARAYLEGRVELQDAASQAVADMVPLAPGEMMLDLCAGGGGKTLAVAGRVAGAFFAYDANPDRMKDLPARASRAGVDVTRLPLPEVGRTAPFHAVLVDAPCSGSGSWRRDPQGKWRLTRETLTETVRLQRDILDQAASCVGPQGHLVYATCSLLECENGDQIRDFLSRRGAFSLSVERRFTPLEGGDGFYCAVLRRN